MATSMAMKRVTREGRGVYGNSNQGDTKTDRELVMGCEDGHGFGYSRGNQRVQEQIWPSYLRR